MDENFSLELAAMNIIMFFFFKFMVWTFIILFIFACPTLFWFQQIDFEMK